MAAQKPARNRPGRTPQPAAKAAQAKAQAKTQPPAKATNQAKTPNQRPAAKAQPPRPSAGQTRRARDRAAAKALAAEQATTGPGKFGPPLWVQLTTFILSLFAFGVSVYLTIEHFTGNHSLVCSATGTFNCDAVTTSPQSMVFGVFPVAVLGLAFYVVVVALMSPWAWRSPRRELGWLRLAAMVSGIGFVLYLVYVELFQVRFICPWCTSVHGITFILFVLVMLTAAIWGNPPQVDREFD